MVDETPTVAGSTDAVCPWCSALYSGDPDTCPSCGAALAVDPSTEQSLPGLTAIDAAAIVRAKTPPPRPRSRLLQWISGDYPDEGSTAADSGALAPPAADVRMEMLRLELEAEVANLQAEAGALMAEATIEGHAPDASPGATAGAEAIVEDLSEVSAELEEVDEALDAAPLADAEPLVDEGTGPA
jgi:hypothetical protein